MLEEIIDQHGSLSAEETSCLHQGEETFGDEAALISEVFQRQALLHDLDRLIIADVRHRARRERLRRWGRIVAFSFGWPLAMVAFFAWAYIYIKNHGASSFVLSQVFWPTLALIYAAHRALHDFSPEEV